jgi:hypothetical protein
MKLMMSAAVSEVRESRSPAELSLPLDGLLESPTWPHNKTRLMMEVSPAVMILKQSTEAKG